MTSVLRRPGFLSSFQNWAGSGKSLNTPADYLNEPMRRRNLKATTCKRACLEAAIKKMETRVFSCLTLVLATQPIPTGSE